ncbi:hypothetical protein B9Z55_002723 [Caenorhabditis nigoni]|uniref:C6 domain-containing protein n=1 Tax=Caenorhabditis nigoni TaxID=1611254 RepID=A0A2G5VLV6_9PELO|nr:hypothetical protein B9Z55_002723 [Caenorhabditis nigoni]
MQVFYSSLFFFTLVIIPSEVNMAPCLIGDDCGCIKRGSFDSAYLETAFPQTYAQFNPTYTFTHPVITYPDCEAIISNCTAPAVITVLYENGTLIVSPKGMKTPNVLSGIYCGDAEWRMQGVGGSVDINIRSVNVSCALKR